MSTRRAVAHSIPRDLPLGAAGTPVPPPPPGRSTKLAPVCPRNAATTPTLSPDQRIPALPHRKCYRSRSAPHVKCYRGPAPARTPHLQRSCAFRHSGRRSPGRCGNDTAKPPSRQRRPLPAGSAHRGSRAAARLSVGRSSPLRAILPDGSPDRHSPAPRSGWYAACLLALIDPPGHAEDLLWPLINTTSS